MPPRNVEATINVKLGELLRNRHPSWNHNNVHAEQTGTLRDHPGQRVDILVENPGGLPVAIETEFSAGPRLRREAEARLGKQLAATGETIEGSLSVVLPEELRTGDPAEVEASELRFATHQLTEGEQPVRWPEDGNEWLRGGIDRVADAIEHVSLSERRIAEGRRVLETCIHDGASLINRKAGEGAIKNIAAKLHQEQGEQTTRMATAILVNAFMFHAALEGEPGIPDRSGWTMDGTLRRNVLTAWREILRINYWPIFDIASKLLGHVPVRLATQLLETLIQAAERLAGIGTSTFHDLSGRMFQTLISDRKFLATFYTLPASACLLAELAVDRLKINWADPEAVSRLEVADFACGTGALITAAQRAVGRRHRRAGGDDRMLHSTMMEQTWVATDIMPAAAHLTASMLSSAHPGARYGSTRVYTMPYGDGEGLVGQIGALELMHENRRLSLFGTGARQVEGTRESDARDIRVLRESLDLVIMNSPFTRPTNHENTDVPRPSFAGLATSEAEQEMMSRRLKKMKGKFGHGNAGLASNFMDLAHNKLKPGGTLALVLPFAFVAGKSWKKARTALADHYESITVTSLAVHGTHDRSFSADSGNAECLVVATKAERGSTTRGRVHYRSLRHRPRSLLEGHENAYQIIAAVDASDLIGTINDGGLAGFREPAVARAMRGLMQGSLTLPRSTKVLNIAITEMSNVAQRGLLHRGINGIGPAGKPRGPFDIDPLTSVWQKTPTPARNLRRTATLSARFRPRNRPRRHH